jgi:hypothetical protein
MRATTYQKMLKRREKFGLSVDRQTSIYNDVVAPMAGDLIDHGYIALKEAGIKRKEQFNHLASILIEHHILKSTDWTGVVKAESVFELTKKLDYNDVTNRLPLLIILFSSPQQNLYSEFIATQNGRDLMEWLSIGDNGTYDFEMLKAQTRERFSQLTQTVLVDRIKGGKIGHWWLDQAIRALGMVNFQHYLCNGEDPFKARRLISARLDEFTRAVGISNSNSPIEALLDSGMFPFPETWSEDSLPIEPQEFLGFPESYSDLNSVVRNSSWGGSALRYYRESNFIHVNGSRIIDSLLECQTLRTYLAKLRRSKFNQEYLMTEGMGVLMEVDHPFPASFSKQYAAHFEKARTQDNDLPDFRSPVTRLYLKSGTTDASAAFEAYFDQALKSQVSFSKSEEILIFLRNINGEKFSSIMNARMAGTPSGSAVKKLYPFLPNPSVYVCKMPDSLRAEQLEKDLGL